MKIFHQTKNRDTLYLLAMLLSIAICFSLWQWIDGRAQNGANCTTPYYVNEELPNGGRWELCWEHRNRDGIVFHDVYYTTPNGARRRVLTEASISQVHVPYDDNSARFHDITDDGFGGRNLADLTEAECPSGTLLSHDDKQVICQQILPRGQAWQTADGQQQGYALNLFHVSTSGEYNYIPVWRFWDDGTVEPIMGASGRLQRFDTGSPHSWPIRENGIGGISHIHNYYWRLDFDIGESGTDDLVEELDMVPSESGGGRSLIATALETESSRSIKTDYMRSWRIRDNNQEQPIGYRIDPRSVGHRDVGPDFEPWTHHDLFVTVYNECERYVSHNPRFNGCGNQIAEFTDGQSLADSDIVLWYGVTFHHVPRDEDEVNMHTHWDGFQISPMNWTAENELVNLPMPTPEPTAGIPPVADFTAVPITGTAPLTVTFNAVGSSDSDGTITDYQWAFGSEVATGISVTHRFSVAGTFPVTLTVTDNGGLASQATQQIEVAPEPIEPCSLGDVSCNGTVDIVDALFILQHHQGSREGSESSAGLPEGTLYTEACDVNEDNQCSLEDALTIFECSTGVANTFCESPGQATASAEEIELFQRLLREENTIYVPLMQ